MDVINSNLNNKLARHQRQAPDPENPILIVRAMIAFFIRTKRLSARSERFKGVILRKYGARRKIYDAFFGVIALVILTLIVACEADWIVPSKTLLYGQLALNFALLPALAYYYYRALHSALVLFFFAIATSYCFAYIAWIAALDLGEAQSEIVYALVAELSWGVIMLVADNASALLANGFAFKFSTVFITVVTTIGLNDIASEHNGGMNALLDNIDIVIDAARTMIAPPLVALIFLEMRALLFSYYKLYIERKYGVVKL